MEIKEAVAWLTPFDTDMILTPDHVEAVECLIAHASRPIDEDGLRKVLKELIHTIDDGVYIEEMEAKIPQALTEIRKLIGR